MKKNILISVLLSVLFLYGCSTSDKLSVDQLFEKKQECANLKNDIEKDIMQHYNISKEILDTELYIKLGEITYSKRLNTCIYSIYAYTIGGNLIYDFFSKELVYTETDCLISEKTDTCKDKSGYNDNCMKSICMTDYYKKLKELKGE